MDDQQNPVTRKEQAKIKKQENYDAAMDMMFGKNRHQYAGNIWGWKFSLLSLAGLLIIVAFASIGIATGNISLNEQMHKANEEKAAKEKARQERIDSTKLY
jgi:hypothetical protein